MDEDARSACLRAVNLVARSARLCATVEPESEQFRKSVESAERMMERGQSYYAQASTGHAPTERVVRLLSTVLVEARAIVTALRSPMPVEAEDLERMASKVERGIARAQGLPVPSGL